MSVVISRPTEEPILLGKVTPPLQTDAMEIIYNESKRLTENITGQIFFIMDVTEAEINFHDSLVSMAKAAKFLKEEDGPDRNTQTTIVFVGSGPILTMAAKAMGQDQYGNIRVPVFEKIDQALDYSRERLAFTGNK